MFFPSDIHLCLAQGGRLMYLLVFLHQLLLLIWGVGCKVQSDLSSLNTALRRRQWQPTPVLLPGKFHGWRSLVGCSPWGCKESDMTERLHFHFSLSCTGEGNGNPLQCSCLENPRDGGVWWAEVYGVAQSQNDGSDLAAAAAAAATQYWVNSSIAGYFNCNYWGM